MVLPPLPCIAAATRAQVPRHGPHHGHRAAEEARPGTRQQETRPSNQAEGCGRPTPWAQGQEAQVTVIVPGQVQGLTVHLAFSSFSCCPPPPVHTSPVGVCVLGVLVCVGWCLCVCWGAVQKTGAHSPARVHLGHPPRTWHKAAPPPPPPLPLSLRPHCL